MPDPLKLPLPFPQSGIVREAAVDEVLSPENSVEFAMNLHFDRIGAATLRNGMTRLGAQVLDNNAILGLGAYRNNAGSIYQALANAGTSVYAFNGTSWSAVRTGLTSGAKARFTNFVDYTFMVNGTGNEVCSTYAGTGSFGSTNVASLPRGDFIENYRSRIWVAQNTLDKVFYSDVVTTSNTITGGTAFLQISPADGEKITGLKRTSRALLVFKQNHIYRIFSTNSTDPDPSIMRGTYSQESIVEGKDGISYHHPSGFYDFVFDGEQLEISRPIIDIVKAIPRSYYENISGWSKDDHKYWSIGDITLGGMAFTNVVVRRTISTKTWTVYSTGSEIRSAVLYDSGADLFQLVGDDDGNVLKFDVGTTDNGLPIYYDLVTHWIYFTQIKSSAKTMTELAALHENAHGGNLEYQTEKDYQFGLSSRWKPIGELTRDIYQIGTLNAHDFTKIRFRFVGNSTGSPFIFRGWEVLNLLTGGEIKKYG